MLASTPVRPHAAQAFATPVAAPAVVAAGSSSAPQQPHQQPPALHQLPQPIASSSRNPQLGPDPFFAYPTPNPEQIEDELPPYWATENVPLGPMLDRLSRKGYGDMRTLVETTLPPLTPAKKAKHVIEYAKSTRQAVLKYLAVLRWKTSVDLATTTSPVPPSSSLLPPGPTASFPTPHSSGESNDTSPTTYPSKGKGRFAGEGGQQAAAGADDLTPRGKVTDARRIQQFLEHQNAQHEAAIAHVRHVTTLVETLRERNADLLTALALRSTGTYPRLPTSLTESFIPRPPLNPPAVLDTIERLNEHLLYRLRCVDYVPPELVVEKVEDGRVHVRGGGPNGWVAQLSVVGFEDDSRWWLTGVDWAWGVEGSRQLKAFTHDERQQILDLANMEVLAPRELSDDKVKANADGQADVQTVDSPLVRVFNFLQHLSLSYQLEVLFSQALALAQGRWRGQLLVEIDRAKKELRLQYWTRQRPVQPQVPTQASVGKRVQPPSTLSGRTITVVGGTLAFSIGESQTPVSETERILRQVAACGVEPVDRVVRLDIGVKWEVGDLGIGGGLKLNDAMDPSTLTINPSSLSARELLTNATRAHASHLARATMAPLLANPRLVLDPLNPPRLAESDSATRPLSLIVPLPAQHGRAHFAVSVSATSGLIEIQDTSGKDRDQVLESNRTLRAKLATASVNDQKTRLGEDLYRLMSAVIMEDVEDNLRQLGLHPMRRVALRTHDLSKTDLHPTSTLFVPLPVSACHYFVCKVTPDGIAFELLKLLRVPMDNGGGLKMAVGDRTPIDLIKLLERRKAKRIKRDLDGMEADDDVAALSKGMVNIQVSEPAGLASRFAVNSKDLRDMFFYCNALVAQTIIEQQLKDRGIPYTTHFPDETEFPAPRSRSALAGMVPNLCVNASDLFKDQRASEVAAPKVFIVINDWWKGTKCSVETIVRLRHRPSVTSAHDTPGSAVASAAPSSVSRAEGIKFDPLTLTVRFRDSKLASCVPDFLEQWERLSKVIMVAGEVNRLNKTEQFRDIHMLSFDLCTATLQYAPGYQVAITYTPSSDSYQASFSRMLPTSTPGVHMATPAMTAGDGELSSPHTLIAPLLSHSLNELTNQSSTTKELKGSNGKQFIQLLRATLPLLIEAEALRLQSVGQEYPALVIRSVSEYRLVWDNENTRYALSVSLTEDSTRFLLTDASKPKGDAPLDVTCGPLTPLPGLERAVNKGFQAARAAKVATPGSVAYSYGGTPAGLAMTPRTPAATMGAGAAGSAGAGAVVTAPRTVGPFMPPAMRLDGRTSILCSTAVVQDVLRAMAGEIETAIASASK